MFKTAVSLEEAGKMQIVALDKTGTITSGEPKVTDIIPASGITEEELLRMAYGLEQKSGIRWPMQSWHWREKKVFPMGTKWKISRRFPEMDLPGGMGEDALAGGNLKFIGDKSSGDRRDEAECRTAFRRWKDAAVL